MHSELKAGTTYVVDHIAADGSLISSEVCHNLIPDEGIAYVLGAAIAGGAQTSQWYIGLFEGNYTPTADIKATTLPAAAVETTAYSGTNRPQFVRGAVTAGVVDNDASKAEFTFPSPKTVYGGFISSSPVKGSTTGTLLSVVRFPSPKPCDTGELLRVRAGFSLISL